MSRHEEAFVVPLPIEHTVRLCREVVAEIGWSVVEQRPDGLKCKEAGLTDLSKGTWAVTINVACAGREDGSTVVSLRGSNMGFGPIQSKHVKGQVGNLRNRIELASTRRHERAATPAGDLAAQLQQLADLHRTGVLSAAEFQEAKAKLLQS